jgi:hypothetical protein
LRDFIRPGDASFPARGLAQKLTNCDGGPGRNCGIIASAWPLKDRQHHNTEITTMPITEAFEEQVKTLLSTMPANSTLAEWQLAYREVIFRMALKILNQFPSAAICNNEIPVTAKVTGGSGEGVNPSIARPLHGDCHFLYLPAFVLAMQTPPVAPPPKK